MKPRVSSHSLPNYTKVAIWLHWMIAILIIVQLVGGKVMDWLSTGSLKYEIFQLHKSFGITILLLSILRLIWRLTHKAPPLPDGMKPYETIAAKVTHIGFYVLIIGIPLAGWIMVSASTREIPTYLFKVIPWPDVPGVTRSEGFEDLMKEVHEYMAYTIAVLLLLHVGAALKHHFINKDNVLLRMLPIAKLKGNDDA